MELYRQVQGVLPKGRSTVVDPECADEPADVAGLFRDVASLVSALRGVRFTARRAAVGDEEDWRVSAADGERSWSARMDGGSWVDLTVLLDLSNRIARDLEAGGGFYQLPLRQDALVVFVETDQRPALEAVGFAPWHVAEPTVPVFGRSVRVRVIEQPGIGSARGAYCSASVSRRSASGANSGPAKTDQQGQSSCSDPVLLSSRCQEVRWGIRGVTGARPQGIGTPATSRGPLPSGIVSLENARRGALASASLGSSFRTTRAAQNSRTASSASEGSPFTATVERTEPPPPVWISATARPAGSVSVQPTSHAAQRPWPIPELVLTVCPSAVARSTQPELGSAKAAAIDQRIIIPISTPPLGPPS